MSDHSMAGTPGPSRPSPEETMTAMLHHLSLQLDRLAADQRADRETNKQQIQQIHENLAARATVAQTTPSMTPGDHTPAEPPMHENANLRVPQTMMGNSTPSAMARRPRPMLPDPVKFDGSRSKFRAWYLEMRNKLLTDGLALGNDADQFRYVFARLGSTPQQLAFTYVETYCGQRPVADFLAYLDRCYGDPDIQSKAAHSLRTIKQGATQPFHQFLPRYELLMANAGGLTWPVPVRISYLEGALNSCLQVALANQLNLPQDYHSYVQQLQTLSTQIERVAATRSAMDNPAAGVTQAETEEMDWESTTQSNTQRAPTKRRTSPPKSPKYRPSETENHMLQGKRAKWVTREELAKRREEGRCYRCGRTGCRVEVCPLKPAKRPTSSKQKISKSSRGTVVQEAAVDESEESSSDRDSEKE